MSIKADKTLFITLTKAFLGGKGEAELLKDVENSRHKSIYKTHRSVFGG